jgi:hypothetical protein
MRINEKVYEEIVGVDLLMGQSQKVTEGSMFIAKLREYIAKKFSENMGKHHWMHNEEKHRIAFIEIEFDYHKIINLLKLRGRALASKNEKKRKEIEEKIKR